VTDSGRDILRGSDKPGVSNLIDIYSVVSGRTPEEVEAEFAGRGYGEFKQAVGDAVVAFLEPVRERYHRIRNDPEAIERVLAEGAGKARAISGPVVRRVRARMGLGGGSA
jgi:tryptophanyl-tRNA synthetase